jgi:hypothetical protein
MWKRQRLSGFQECSRTPPWVCDNRYAPGLIFSFTTYGLVHLASHFLVLLVWGLHNSTKFPASNSRSLTYEFLHALVSSWYFSKFTTALSLSDSSRSFSSISFGHAMVSVVVHRLRCFISSSKTASAPYINQKGENLLLYTLWCCGSTLRLAWPLPFSFLFSLQYLFDCFDCPIWLWVIHWCEDHLHSNLLAEITEHCIVKVLCIIDCYVPGDAITTDDVLPKEFLDWSGAHIGEWFRFYSFCEVFDRDHREGIIALHRSQPSDDIDAPSL